MEIASSPVLHTFRSATTTAAAAGAGSKAQFCAGIRNRPSLVPPFSVNFPEKISNFRGKCPRLNPPLTPLSSSSPSHYLSDDDNPSQELAVLLEVEGVLVDGYRQGNRQAFNTAFRKLGLDCANWSEPVYIDLVRKSIGDDEGMLIFYFNRIGWPTSLPTSEKASFIKSVLREKENAFNEFLVSKDLPLRPGVEEFIDDAHNGDVPVVILTAYSRSADKIARSITEKLGDERVSKVKIVGNQEVEQSLYGRLVRGKGVSSGLDDQLAKQANEAVSAEKQRIAEEVASKLKLSVNIDTTPSESLEKIIATLRAGAETAGLPVYNCVLVAGSQSGVAGAERAGMPCVVLRSSLTSRAQFPSAKAILDGFGGADLTISKLRQKRWS